MPLPTSRPVSFRALVDQVQAITNYLYGNLTDTAVSFVVAKYKGVATAGWGVPVIYGYGRATAQTAAVASVAAYTNGAADGSFWVSGNILMTAYTAGSIAMTCAYTDEGNTARALTMLLASTTGSLEGNTVGATGPAHGWPMQIRCKANTSITIATTASGFTGTYNVEGAILQVA